MSVNSKPKVSNSKITVQQWLQQATEALKAVGIPSARLDAELLLADALKVDRPWLIAHNDTLIATGVAQDTLHRRTQREPLAYIRGWQEFYGRRFIVSSNVLIPRPESETLIEFLKSLETPSDARLIDVGTGSGCLGITAALELPNTHVTLVDISDSALTIARQNITQLAAQRTTAIATITSDLLGSVSVDSPVDIIIANLPYVDREWQRSPETNYEPSLALFAEDQGLALIKTLITQAETQLTVGGYLLLEADTRQLDDIAAIAQQHTFSLLKREGFCLAFQKES